MARAPVPNRTSLRGKLTAVLAVSALFLASAVLFSVIRSETGDQTAEDRVGGAFHLVDTQNRPVTDRDFRGRYMLVYFGYTGCPDICPTTLSSVTQALRLLGKRAALVQPIFITVDPQHDTPTVLGRYVASFSPNLVGLTGTPADLRAAERAYHVTVDMTARGIDHTAVLYLMAPDGRFLAPLPADNSAAALARDINHDLT